MGTAGARRRRQRVSLTPSDLAKRVGRLVRAARIAKGMSQVELAAPMTRAMVSAVELGKTSPSLETLARFASRLDLRVKDLVPDD
jgi:ribosome-binding protein aMBF1 (putative translation factor)